jgi:hypothetical protein
MAKMLSMNMDGYSSRKFRTENSISAGVRRAIVTTGYLLERPHHDDARNLALASTQ